MAPTALSAITTNDKMDSTNDAATTNGGGEHPFCSLPGDPSLILTTNVDLGDKKMEIMKGKDNCNE